MNRPEVSGPRLWDLEASWPYHAPTLRQRRQDLIIRPNHSAIRGPAAQVHAPIFTTIGDGVRQRPIHSRRRPDVSDRRDRNALRCPRVKKFRPRISSATRLLHDVNPCVVSPAAAPARATSRTGRVMERRHPRPMIAPPVLRPLPTLNTASHFVVVLAPPAARRTPIAAPTPNDVKQPERGLTGRRVTSACEQGTRRDDLHTPMIPPGDRSLRPRTTGFERMNLSRRRCRQVCDAETPLEGPRSIRRV